MEKENKTCKECRAKIGAVAWVKYGCLKECKKENKKFKEFIEKLKEHFDVLDFESSEALEEYLDFIDKLVEEYLIENGNKLWKSKRKM